MKHISWRRTLLLIAFAILAMGMTMVAGSADAFAQSDTSESNQAETASADAVATEEAADSELSVDEAAADEAEAIIDYDTYITILPAASGGGLRVLTVRFFSDGTMQWDTQFQNGEPPIREVGTWEDSGEGMVTVTITGQADAAYDEPAVIVFQKDGDALIATDYEVSLFGSQGLTLRAATDILANIETALFTINLSAGFPLDPTFMSVNAGGEVPAELLGVDCTGYINPEPIVTLNWSGEADMLKAFMVSNDDPTMVIMTPSGNVLCNDDASKNLLDPVIQMDMPEEGEYRIWAGSYAAGQLLPGVLVLTTKPEVEVGTFNLGGLIRRGPISELGPAGVDVIDEETLMATLQAAADSADVITQAELPTSVDVVAEGNVPLFALPLVEEHCAGLVTPAPSYTFNWQGSADVIRVHFEGDGDSSLLVIGPDKSVTCADDSADGVNQNPVIDIDSPTEGLYAVWVGRFDPETPVSGQLSVTDTSDEPEVLSTANE